MPFLARFWAALFALLLLFPLPGCSLRTDDPEDQSAQSQSDPTPEDIASNLRPADEANLMNMPQQAEDQVTKAPNSYRANQLEDVWADRWCTTLKRVRTFKDWTGVLKSVDAGQLEISLGWALNFRDDSAVSSGVFHQAANLKEGIAVKVSGTIDEDGATCGDWSDVGSGDQIVHFSSISPI